jgi:cytidyltransferase-like protein
MQKSTKKIIITSGYFNPLHIGHINLMSEAKNLGDFLIVIVNNDEQVKMKGSVPFMSQEERLEIIKNLKFVDQVFLSVDKNRTVAESLKAVAKMNSGAEFAFAKGGDRNTGNLPEEETKACDEFNIQIINDVGGGKVQSSSWLIKNSLRNSEGSQNQLS